jgi:hypothetical protein
MNEVVRALDPLVQRDNEIWPQQVDPYRMRYLTLLNALRLIPETQRVALAICDMEGKTRTVSLEADASQSDIWNTFPKNWITLPQVLPGPLCPAQSSLSDLPALSFRVSTTARRG